MQPYPNQNYFTQYPYFNNQYLNSPQQSAYLAQSPYTQNQQSNLVNQQQTIPGGLVGKIVDSFDSITANDVPMDGNMATFIKRDGSEIQTRTWTASGTIATTTYKPDKEIVTATEKSNDISLLNDDMKAFREEINGRFDKLEKAILRGNRGTKKEVSDEE